MHELIETSKKFGVRLVSFRGSVSLKIVKSCLPDGVSEMGKSANVRHLMKRSV
jgi:hypothetical protein